jgi:hypothetical protein
LKRFGQLIITRLWVLGLSSIALLLVSGWGHAIGLGDIKTHSFLGQPLDADVAILQSEGLEFDEIAARQLSNTRAQELGIDLLLQNFKLDLEILTSQNGDYYLHLTSRRNLNDSFVNVVIEIKTSSGRAHREYTILLDVPPTISRGKLPNIDLVQSKNYRNVLLSPVKSKASSKENLGSSSSGYQQKQGSRNGAIPSVRSEESFANSYKVQPGDSLSRIVGRLDLPEGMSSQAAIELVFSSNSQAFVGGNIHRIKAGVLLVLPDFSGDAEQVSPERPKPRDNGSSPRVNVDHTSRVKGRVRLSELVPGKHLNEKERRELLESKIDGAQEMIDLLARENEDLRGRIDKIETSGYLERLTKIANDQRDQIERLRVKINAGKPSRADTLRPVVTQTKRRDSNGIEQDLSLDQIATSEDNKLVDEKFENIHSNENDASFGERLSNNVALFGTLFLLVILIIAALAYRFYRTLNASSNAYIQRQDSRDPVFKIKDLHPRKVESDRLNTEAIDKRRRRIEGQVNARQTQENERMRKIDSEVKERIEKKRDVYEASSGETQAQKQFRELEMDVTIGMDDEVNELLSMAKIYCHAGKFSEARAILSAQQHVESDPRLGEAIEQINDLEKKGK